MTDQQHPITPPLKLVKQWLEDGPEDGELSISRHIATQAAQWGSDQELEACCQVLYARYDIPNCIAPRMAEDMREWLRASRRPKPPSLKDQALKALDNISIASFEQDAANTIRRALEQLDD